MTMNLQWTSNVNLSAYHTIWCLNHFPDRELTDSSELLQAAVDLQNLVEDIQTPPLRFWDQLFTLSATVDYSGALAERLSQRIGLSSKLHTTRLAAELNNCRRQFERVVPNYATEILLRTGPLRQMWDGHGAGLLRQIVLLTEEQLLVADAQVVLVQPVLGGMGYAHLTTNRIHLEGLLTHAAPQLPESLRIAWLLSQLDLERPVYSELINALRLRSVAGLAMLPVVLAAGQELELCQSSPQLLRQAIELWYVDTLQIDAATISAIVSTWWETCQSSRPAWKTALTGLDQMLQG